MEKRKYVQDKNWRAYNVSFFSQGSGRVVTSCAVFEQWISAVVLSKLQTLQTTLLLCCCPNYKTTFKYFITCMQIPLFHINYFFTIIFLLAMLQIPFTCYFLQTFLYQSSLKTNHTICPHHVEIRKQKIKKIKNTVIKKSKKLIYM